VKRKAKRRPEIVNKKALAAASFHAVYAASDCIQEAISLLEDCKDMIQDEVDKRLDEAAS